MTTLADNRIDELISRVKKRGAIKDFCFIPAYPPDKTPSPIKKYTVTAENRGMREKRVFIGNTAGANLSGRLYEVLLRARVYAPSYTSGSALLRACSMLADAFESEDRDRLINATSFSGVGYDTSSRTEYRDIEFTLEMLLTEEATA